VLIVWGGDTKTDPKSKPTDKQDDGLYLLNLGVYLVSWDYVEPEFADRGNEQFLETSGIVLPGRWPDADRLRSEGKSLVFVAVDGTMLGAIAVADRPRETAREAIELLRKVVQLEPRNVFAQHALGVFYIRTGEKNGAMQQYDILKTLNPKLAADLLKSIPK